MKEYVDSSVLLRIVLNSPMALNEWKNFRYPSSSALLQVECLRTIDRLQLTGELKQHEVALTYAALHEMMGRTELLKIDMDVIERAGGSFGLPLKTLDAIHLVTAIVWRERLSDEVTFATHDKSLAAAARTYHFPVIGA
ncbi:MAG: type II toxin-antitoxin system VapC family toxin [Acidobacteriota bacterium]|nr:type II toxin-antitoxin system VapC family toxin [Acidobacteriota bacterium]